VHLIVRGSGTRRVFNIIEINMPTGVGHEEQTGGIRYPTDTGHSSFVYNSLQNK